MESKAKQALEWDKKDAELYARRKSRYKVRPVTSRTTGVSADFACGALKNRNDGNRPH